MKSSIAKGAASKPTLFRFKSETIVELIAALFILLFLYTAISKSFQISKTESVLRRTPFFTSFAPETAWTVVILEYLVALQLFFPKTKRIGLYSSFVLMLGFTVYISLMMVFVPNLPCTCGGIISKMTWNEHLAFNVICIALAATGIKLSKKSTDNHKRGSELHNVTFT